MLSRRRFLQSAPIATAAAVTLSCSSTNPRRLATPSGVARLLFVSQGRTGIVNADGTGLRYLELDRPGQVTWQPAGFFSDGRRVLLLSMEARRDGPGRPFDEYYHQTPTHLWIHDLDSGALEEIATRDRMAVFYAPQLLLSDHRILVQVVKRQGGQIFSMNLDGSDAREFTRAGDGFPYGLSPSPDRRRVAYHLATHEGYQIWTSDLEGQERRKTAAQSGRLYFGPVWSPDGEWLAFQDCHEREDPGHDWSDVSICRPDGSEFRHATQNQAMWFGATYGPADNRGGGSNSVAWTADGQLLFPRRQPGSKVAWEYRVGRPDTDHFNRDFKPELARGGTQICRLNPQDGSVFELTPAVSGRWDFRASESPDGRRLVFCRADTGDVPSLWVADALGGNLRFLTKGLADRGVDHPRWLPVPGGAA
jgi:TolB protein